MVVGAAGTVMLATMARCPGSHRHGLDLIRSTGLPSGTVYRTLVRLERAGLIAGRWQDERRGYRLTPDGVRVAADRRRAAAGVAQQPSKALPWAGPRWIGVTLVAAFASYLTLSRPEPVRMTDLGVYLGAVDGLRHGASLYDFMSAGHAPFTYPPFAGLLFGPLARTATLPLQVAWTLATIAIVVVLAGMLACETRETRAAGDADAADAAGAARAARNAPVIAAVLLLSAPVASNLKYGQVSVALATLVLLDVLALRANRCQGVLIGVAAAIKLTPLIFIPMLWLAGRRRAAVVATWTFTACALLAWVLLPDDSVRYWSTEMWRVSRLGYITSVGNQSLNGALMRSGVDGAIRSSLVLVAGGAVTAIALRRAAHLGRRGDWLSATVVTGSAGIVLSPVSWTHHQGWLVLAALLPVAAPTSMRRAWTLAVTAVMVLPVTALGPPVWSNLRLVAALVVACLLPIGGRPQWPPIDDCGAEMRCG